MHPFDFREGIVDAVAGHFAASARVREFENPAAGIRQRLADAEEFIFRRKGAGDGLAIDRTVAHGATGREAQRTGLQALAHDRVHALDVLGGSGLVARTALPHHVGAHGTVGNVCTDIDGQGRTLEGVEIFGEGLPIPLNALGQRRTRDVLHAFHQPYQPLAALGRSRCKAHAAVAKDRGRHAVPAGGQQMRIPGGLGVVVGVDVDKARRHPAAAGIDLARCRAEARPDFAHATFVDGDIRFPRLGTGAIHQRASANDQLVHGEVLGF